MPANRDLPFFDEDDRAHPAPLSIDEGDDEWNIPEPFEAPQADLDLPPDRQGPDNGSGREDHTAQSQNMSVVDPVLPADIDPEMPAEAVEQVSERDLDLRPAPGFEKLSQIDYYVKLSGGRDVSRDSVLAIYREAAAGISKTHGLYGLRLPDKVWVDIENEPEEARFGDLVMTVQLADRNGPMSHDYMTRFAGMVSKLSESTGRGFSFMAPIECAQQQAMAIDRLRRKFDSIFVLYIKPKDDEYFDGTLVERFANQIGLTPTGDTSGFYARYKPVDKQKVCLYSMSNLTDSGEFDFANMRGARMQGVAFFTRPAVNCLPGAVFAEMVDTAKAFASRIKGELIAPDYHDLSNDNIESVRRSIDQVASEMASYGITPGSPEAIRLF